MSDDNLNLTSPETEPEMDIQAEEAEGQPEAAEQAEASETTFEQAAEATMDKDDDKKAFWYVVHTYSGYENKVKANLEKTVENRNMQDRIL